MIKIRLAKFGRKKDPFYRIVVIDERRKNRGKTIEVVGHWYPKKNDKKIDKKAISEWLNKGAKMTDAVANLLK